MDSILKDDVIARCSLKERKVFLKSLGAKKVWFQKQTWSIKFESQEDMLNIFTKLNESGAAFSYDQHGWGSSSVLPIIGKKDPLMGK